MPLLDDIATYLTTCTPTLGLITKTFMPATPNVVLSIHEYSAASPEFGFGTTDLKFEYPGLQLRARGEAHNATEPLERLRRAWRFLARVQGTTLGSTKYLMLKPNQSPFPFEIDGSNRHIFYVNFRVEKEVS